MRRVERRCDVPIDAGTTGNAMTRRRHLLHPAVPQAPAEERGPALTLLVRRWCSLCDVMRDAAAPVAARHGYRIVDIDLDLHPEWEPRFGTRVPVLLFGAAPDGEPLAELSLDAPALERRLARASVAGNLEIR